MGHRASYVLIEDGTTQILGWGDISFCPYLRRVFLPVLRHLWSGWNVEWATQGIVDFARYLGRAKEVWIWQWRTLDPRYLCALEDHWPGWRIEGHVDGMMRQVQLSGRDPSNVARSAVRS